MVNRSLILIFLLSLISFPTWALGDIPRLDHSATPGKPAIDFTLSDLEGKNLKLSDFKGKIVMLNFWATWCPPCRAEMPSLQTLYEKLKGDNFEMMAISVDRGGRSVVFPFIEKRKYTFKVLLDPQGKVASQYGVLSIPTTFIIDKEGKIIDKKIGALDWSEKSVVKWLRSQF